MKWTRPVLSIAMLWVMVGAPAAAQDPPAKNPLEGNADAIRSGMGLFRGRCADCHGMDARGVRAPDITQVWASGRTDDGLFKTSRAASRVPRCRPTRASSTTKRGRSSPTCARWPRRPRPIRRAATPRTARRSSATSAPVVTESNGSRRAPGARSVAHRRRAVARHDGAADSWRRRRDFGQGYAPVTLTPPTGPPIHGVKKNEDLFSVQIMDTARADSGIREGQDESGGERHAGRRCRPSAPTG